MRVASRSAAAADEMLDELAFDRSGVAASQLRALAEGEYVARAEPILLIGEPGTGKTHLA